jgi:hypothetical protein
MQILKKIEIADYFKENSVSLGIIWLRYTLSSFRQ